MITQEVMGQVLLSGDNFEFEVSKIHQFPSAKKKNPGETKGVVVIGEVISGEMPTRSELKICTNGVKVPDSIVRIESYRKEIRSASSGSKIGICLADISIGSFRAILKKSNEEIKNPTLK